MYKISKYKAVFLLLFFNIFLFVKSVSALEFDDTKCSPNNPYIVISIRKYISMLPNISSDSSILIKCIERADNISDLNLSISKGDIIIFKSTRDNETYIKRVIGLPGDKIRIQSANLIINERPTGHRFIGEYSSKEASYDKIKETLDNGRFYNILIKNEKDKMENTMEYKVPPNHFFVLGDNRDESLDSRFLTGGGIGFVPAFSIVGKYIDPPKFP